MQEPHCILPVAVTSASSNDLGAISGVRSLKLYVAFSSTVLSGTAACIRTPLGSLWRVRHRGCQTARHRKKELVGLLSYSQHDIDYTDVSRRAVENMVGLTNLLTTR